MRAREAGLWVDAEAILCLLERVGVRFDAAALSLDAMPDLDTDECESWLTDGGHGAKSIRGETPEQEDTGVTRRKRLNRARMAVTRNMPECLTTFRLVIKNGTNRKESIWELMKGQPNGTRRNTATVHN